MAGASNKIGYLIGILIGMHFADRWFIRIFMITVTSIYLFKPTLCCQDLSLDTIGTSAFTKDRFFRKAQNCLVKTNLKDKRVNYLALLPCSVLQVKYMDRLFHILFNLTRQFWTSLNTDTCDNNLIIFLVEGLQSTIQLVPFALAILSGVTKGAVHSILSKCASHYYGTTITVKWRYPLHV